jgi:hypothetical protein
MIVGGEATKGQAFFTMGTPEMLKKGGMSRVICPGMSNRHHDGQKNNTHSVPYNVNHLVSPTHCIIIDTNTAGQSHISNDNDGIYVGITIKIGNELRIIHRVHENRVCSKPDDKQKYCSELVRYEIRIIDHTY